MALASLELTDVGSPRDSMKALLRQALRAAHRAQRMGEPVTWVGRHGFFQIAISSTKNANALHAIAFIRYTGVPCRTVALAAADLDQAMKAPRITDVIRQKAVEVILAHPQGLLYRKLFQILSEQNPSFDAPTIHRTIFTLDNALPKLVWKPAIGLYCHTAYRVGGMSPVEGHALSTAPTKPREEQFYAAFADWLTSDVSEVTLAVPLGGSTFRDRWGTPDVIGKKESRRTDLIKAPTEIVAAEIKTDALQLITAFGQAIAYRLFSHRSYLVVPRQSSAEELMRLEDLCEMYDIGLVTFDRDNASVPAFKMCLRARTHQPKLSYTNRYLTLIERSLFA